MLPVAQMAVTLLATKGVQLATLSRRGARRRSAGRPDAPLDWALAGLAVAPMALAVLGSSRLTEATRPLSLGALRRLVRAKPYLESASALALGALVYREAQGASRGRALGLGLRMVSGLKAAAPWLSGLETPAGPGLVPSGLASRRELDRRLKPDAPVVGVSLNGETRVYPLELLERARALPDTLGGEPLLVTYCPVARTAVVLRDALEGERMHLQPVGAPEGNTVFLERRTGSLFHQLALRFEEGPLAGTALVPYPAVVGTWSGFRALHPHATGWLPEEAAAPAAALGLADAKLALAALRNRFGGAPSAARSREGERAVGVRVGDRARAYDLGRLAEQGAMEDELGGEPIVVLHDARRGISGVFSRRWGYEVLAIEAHPDRPGLFRARLARGWINLDVTGFLHEPLSQPLTPVGTVVPDVAASDWLKFQPGAERWRERGERLSGVL